MARAPKKNDAAEEAAEQPFEDSLTPIGKLTLARYKSRFGEEAGETKFQSALSNGTISRDKMVKASTAKKS